MPKKSGFTLIELLVVITIIGILSVIGMSAYSSLTTKAGDIKKKADIDQIASVYELRYDNKTHKYKALTDADFSNNKPDTTNYSGILNEDGQTFNICATLSDGTNYCKESAHQASVVFIPPVVIPTPAPTPIPTPTPTPPPPPTPFPCSSGLLTNGCFEALPADGNWWCGGAIGGSCSGDSTVKYSGSSSVKVINTGGYWGWQLSQGDISASLGEKFCLSARVKKQKLTDIVSIAIQEIGPSTNWREVDLWAENVTDWQLVRSTVTVATNWSPPIQVFLRVWYANQAAWFDDVSLTRGACP